MYDVCFLLSSSSSNRYPKSKRTESDMSQTMQTIYQLFVFVLLISLSMCRPSGSDSEVRIITLFPFVMEEKIYFYIENDSKRNRYIA